MEKNLIPDWLKNWYIGTLNPIVRMSTAWNIHPNLLTTISLLISLWAASALIAGHLRWGGVLILVSGSFDIIDGAVARASKRVTKFGALYDSSLDRYSELAVLFGILGYFINTGYSDFTLIVMPIALAVCGSFMVSYVRARAEGLGYECKIGLMQRPERIVLLGFGAIFHERILMIFIILIAVLSNITALQRIFYIWKLSSKEER